MCCHLGFTSLRYVCIDGLQNHERTLHWLLKAALGNKNFATPNLAFFLKWKYIVQPPESHYCIFFFVFVLHSSPGWPQTQDHLASASWVLFRYMVLSWVWWCLHFQAWGLDRNIGILNVYIDKKNPGFKMWKKKLRIINTAIYPSSYSSTISISMKDSPTHPNDLSFLPSLHTLLLSFFVSHSSETSPWRPLAHS